MSQSTVFKIARLVLDYCEVLAWPIVVLVCIRMFRMEIRSLLDRLRHLNAFGAESSFDSGLTKLSPEQQVEKERVDAVEEGSSQAQGVGTGGQLAGREAQLEVDTAQVHQRILAQLEREFGVAPESNVVWKGRPDMVFDAYIKRADPVFVEIKLTTGAVTVDAAATHLREKLKELERDVGVKARGIVVVATNAANLPQLEAAARLAKQKYKGIDVRIYDVDLLNP